MQWMINAVLGDDPLLRPSVMINDIGSGSGRIQVIRRYFIVAQDSEKLLFVFFFFFFFHDLMEEKKNEKSMISKEEHNLYEPRTNTRRTAHFRITYFR